MRKDNDEAPASASAEPAVRRPGRPGGDESRSRILEAAGRLFAQHGLANVSVRELARHAQVNIAAINYHFGSKDALYHEVLRKLIEDTEPFFGPLVQAVEEGVRDANGDRRALARVTAQFLRILLEGVLSRDEFRWRMPMVLREFHDPSPEFPMLLRDRIGPVHDAIAGLVAAATGLKRRAPETLLLTANVIAQCMMFGVTRALIMARLGWDGYTPERIELIVRTITPRILAMLDLPSAGLAGGRRKR